MKLRSLLALVLFAAPAAAADRLNNLEALFEKVDPAVVTVRVALRKMQVSEEGLRMEVGLGTGSGVVLHADGFIATAAHVVDVVEQAEKINVEFQDGTEADAEIVTLSRTEDVALLKVEKLPKGIVVPVLADSDKLKVGQPVFSIGAPMGLKHTLTAGLISAIRHDPPKGLVPGNVIQTDAALNQGNSGGAVFNERGEVVGLASYIATLSGGSMGLGFAVPSNLVRKRLFENALPYLGVSLRVIPRKVNEIFNWPYENALLIERVREGSAAAKAGLRGGQAESDVAGSPVLLGGDLIVKVGQHETTRLDLIGDYLHTLKEGDTLRYVVMRGGKLYDVDVQIPKLTPVPSLGTVKAEKPKK
jgi:serine protease Do